MTIAEAVLVATTITTIVGGLGAFGWKVYLHREEQKSHTLDAKKQVADQSAVALRYKNLEIRQKDKSIHDLESQVVYLKENTDYLKGTVAYLQTQLAECLGRSRTP